MNEGGKKLTLLGHFRELRKRLILGVIAVAITTAVAFFFYDRIFDVLLLPAKDIQLVFIEMTEMVGTIMRVCLGAGIILAMPFLTLQAVLFIAPALTRREKKYIYVLLPWITVMFLGGVVFGYFILIPPATSFLLSFGSDIAVPQIKIGNYVSVITRLLLAIGLVFEMPVVLTFLARIGIVSSKWLAGKRKIAILLSFVMAAIITPTFDPVNQSLVAVPLILLYEIGIWLAKLVERKKSAVPVTSPGS